jgi:hypothetical protein
MEDRFAYDPVPALRNAPRLMGLELRECGPNKLCGGYYIDGEPHAYRRDKLKVYIWKGVVFVSEEGGPTMSLTTWLQQYGGAADYREALGMIKGGDQALHWDGTYRHVAKVERKHVSPDVLQGAKEYDLRLSPLFRHMCRLFPEEVVREVWAAYEVTATPRGGTCFWYLNPSGQICHDKVVWYGEDGHRKKELPMGRRYRIGDGYTENPMFGSHLQGTVRGVLESEKSCLYAACYYGGVWLGTGGKNNIRDVAGLPLYPDRDAEEAWSRAGDCVDWYSEWPECGEHCDLGDKIEWLILNNSK